MSSPTQGAWACRHNVDGRDFCPECHSDGTVVLEQVTSTKYVLQAAMTEAPEQWVYMEGFTYDTVDELNECYEKHFRRIDGQGCVYRFVKVEQSMRVTVVPGGSS